MASKRPIDDICRCVH